jgi:hypothetical protein
MISQHAGEVTSSTTQPSPLAMMTCGRNNHAPGSPCQAEEFRKRLPTSWCNEIAQVALKMVFPHR